MTAPVRVPRLAARYRAVRAGDEGVLLLSETGCSALAGRLFARVVPLIDGTTTAHELATRLADTCSAAEVSYALLLLARGGFVADAAGAPPPSVDDVYWSSLGIADADPVRRDGAPRVALEACGAVDATPLADALASAGVQLGDDLRVVVTDDMLRVRLRDVNREALARGAPWLLVRPVGRLVSVGPLFVPGRTGCWACLSERLRRRTAESALRARTGGTDVLPVPLPSSEATRDIAFGMAAAQIAAWVARGGSSPELEGTIVTFDVSAFTTRRHALVRRTFCAACGTAPPNAHAGGAVELRSRPKSFGADGGHRTASPDETLRRYEHLVSPLTGIVADVARRDVGSDVLYVYTAGDNFAVPQDPRAEHLRSRSCGKGVTRDQARASALCESIERFSGVFDGTEPRRRATLRELGESAVDPRACMLFSDRQYAERERWNALGSRFHTVPLPFGDDDAVAWSPAWSLTRGEQRWLPSAYLYYAYPDVREHGFFRACSNGNASGNTLEEAIVQGFLELVERDAAAIWWYNRLPCAPFDLDALDALDAAYVGTVRSFLAERDRTLWMLDLTCDTGIPVFAALSATSSGSRIMLGLGAHHEPRLAVLRAVTELVQMLSWVLAQEQGRSDTSLRDDLTLAWLRDATLENQPHLRPAGAPRGPRAFPYERRDDLRDDVDDCLRVAARLGSELLVVDQTRPDIGMPVVKVLVPGMRHFHARFAPGRLYDVPVRMGRRSAPLDERDLNPVPMFL